MQTTRHRAATALLATVAAMAFNGAVNGAANAAPHAHEHGVARLNLATDGPSLVIALEGSLDGFVGFERAPRTDAERKAAATALARLRDGTALFRPDAAAGCRLVAANVSAPVLEGKGGPGEHADLDADYSFDCQNPAALKGLDLGLFEAFARLQRLDVQVAGAAAGAKGQAGLTLKRPARRVTIRR